MNDVESYEEEMLRATKSKDVSDYCLELQATWHLSDGDSTSLPKGWSIFEGVEHYDCGGFDGLDWIVEITSDQDEPIFLAVTAQKGNILCCAISPCLKRLRKMAPCLFDDIEDAYQRKTRYRLEGRTP